MMLPEILLDLEPVRETFQPERLFLNPRVLVETVISLISVSGEPIALEHLVYQSDGIIE